MTIGKSFTLKESITFLLKKKKKEKEDSRNLRITINYIEIYLLR